MPPRTSHSGRGRGGGERGGVRQTTLLHMKRYNITESLFSLLCVLCFQAQPFRFLSSNDDINQCIFLDPA